MSSKNQVYEGLHGLFLDNVESKLQINFDDDEILENEEWVDNVIFSLPYIFKAFERGNEILKSENEIQKIGVVKKVNVESVKHLTKHTDMVMKYDQERGNVIPEKLLAQGRSEVTNVTYETRFLFTLVRTN